MIWQRDINAANNMITIARRVVEREDRHPLFSQPLLFPDETERLEKPSETVQRTQLLSHKRQMAARLRQGLKPVYE